FMQRQFDAALKAAREAATQATVVAPSPITNNNNLVVSVASNLVVAGNCGSKHLFRLDNFRPLGVQDRRSCSDIIGLAEARNAYVEKFSDGVGVRDMVSGKPIDAISNPFPSGGVSGHGAVLPDEKAVVVSGYDGESYTLDLVDLVPPFA